MVDTVSEWCYNAIVDTVSANKKTLFQMTERRKCHV